MRVSLPNDDCRDTWGRRGPLRARYGPAWGEMGGLTITRRTGPSALSWAFFDGQLEQSSLRAWLGPLTLENFIGIPETIASYAHLRTSSLYRLQKTVSFLLAKFSPIKIAFFRAHWLIAKQIFMRLPHTKLIVLFKYFKFLLALLRKLLNSSWGWIFFFFFFFFIHR
jgi:hypothetical protein